LAKVISKRRQALFGHIVKTGCHHTCTPSDMPGHCNERQSESGDKLAKTSWASLKDLDISDRQWNTSQLETDVAECR